jgi:hypothetical protein
MIQHISFIFLQAVEPVLNTGILFQSFIIPEKNVYFLFDLADKPKPPVV